MGQVHPQGPNEICLMQHGGGKNCDCSPPNYDKSYFDPRLAQSEISQPEFTRKIDDVMPVQSHYYI